MKDTLSQLGYHTGKVTRLQLHDQRIMVQFLAGANGFLQCSQVNSGAHSLLFNGY